MPLLHVELVVVSVFRTFARRINVAGNRSLDTLQWKTFGFLFLVYA
jgi:TRAP-type mannitol/chloroaromatic compound transport system permease small subunit